MAISRYKNVRSIGSWAGICPHPRQLMSGQNNSLLNSNEREMIATYIESTPIIHGKKLIEFEEPDLVDPNQPPFDCFLRCDGVWLFPVSLASYIRDGIKIPPRFVEHVRKANYLAPTSGIDWNEIRDDAGGYWIHWCITNVSPFQWMTLPYYARLVLLLPLRYLLMPFRLIFRRLDI